MPTDELLRKVLRVVAPPSRSVSHGAVATDLLLPDGPKQGKPYRWKDDPVHLHVTQQLDNPYWDSFALVGAVQTGKSLVSILVPMLRQLIHHRRAVVYAQPSQQKLHEAWTGKVMPAIEGAGLGGWLPTEGQGARGGQTPRFVVFRDPVSRARAGMLYLIHGGGANEGAQASVSAPTVLVDEVDSFKGAHRVALIGKRADSFGRQARRVYTSTVKADGEPGAEDGSVILGMYQDSTRSRLHYPCAHCRAWITLDWEMATYDPADEATAAETIKLTCPSCAATITDDQRQEMLRQSVLVHHTQTVAPNGTIIGAIPRTHRFGLLWTALDSTLRDLPTLAIEHWRATQSLARGDCGAMRSFVRDQLCRPYTQDDSDRPDLVESMLLDVASRATYQRGQVPAEAEGLVFVVDVQLRRHYWLVLAYADDQWWIVDWGRDSICGDMEQPTDEQRAEGLERLDAIARSGYPTATGGRMSVNLAGIDTGYMPDLIRPWVARHRNRWISVRGIGSEMAGRMKSSPYGTSLRKDEGWFDLRQQDDATDRRQLFVDADPCLDRIAQQWRNGIGHLPTDADNELIRHLTGMRPGDGKQRWVPRGARHDFLDDLIYGTCLARIAGKRKFGPVAAGGRKYGAVGTIS